MANLGERLLRPDPTPPVSVEERRHKELLIALASLSARIDDLTQRPLPDVVVGAPDMGPVHEAMRVLAERGDPPLHEPVAFPDMEALFDRFAAALPPDRSILVAEALEQVKEALTRLSKKVGALGIMPSGGASGHVLVDNAPTTPVNVHDAKLDGTIDTTGSVSVSNFPSSVEVSNDVGNAIPVDVTDAFALDATLATTNTELGGLTEAAPGTDTASSGLNGRLQRVAQRLTSLIALFPTSIGQKTKAGSLSVTLASDSDTLTVDVLDAFALEATAQAVKTSVEIMDDWDESDRAKVNPVVGQAGVAAGSGVVGTNTQRVVLATDVALPAGTNQLGSVVPNRPSQGPGRTNVSKTTGSVTGSTNLHTVTTGKTFYLTSYSLTFRNTNVTTGGEVSVVDSTTTANPRIGGTVGVGVAGTVAPSHALGGDLPEPIPFTDTVRLVIVSGTIVADLTITGYEQ